jgi:DNA repair protein RadC
MTHYQTALVDIPLLMVRENAPDILDSAAVANHCADMRYMAQEAFQILTLDGKRKLIARHLVTLGLVDSSLVHPREVFRRCITDNAHAVILVHNHPSGDPTPSAEDIRITRQLVGAGKIVGIQVLDHIIIGRPSFAGGVSPGYFSMLESCIVDFTNT